LKMHSMLPNKYRPRAKAKLRLPKKGRYKLQGKLKNSKRD
jgi:hypothetical protein